MAVKKKAVKKLPGRKVPRKAPRKAPVKAIALYVAYIIYKNKKWYFTGTGFNDALKYAVIIQRSSDSAKKYLGSWARKVWRESTMENTIKVHVILFKNTRAKNPVPLATNTKIAKAVDLFRNFTGHEPEFVDTVNFNMPDVGMLIGKCDGVLYTTVRDGKTEKYIHEFTGRTRPLLAVSFDGKQLLMLGGAYTFTERGIVG